MKWKCSRKKPTSHKDPKGYRDPRGPKRFWGHESQALVPPLHYVSVLHLGNSKNSSGQRYWVLAAKYKTKIVIWFLYTQKFYKPI